MDLATLSARCLDEVRLHRVRHQVRNGVGGFLKTRRRGMQGLYGPGNLFLSLSGSGIRMFGNLAEWQAHEISSFRLCHPNYKAEVIGKRAVFLESLPGKSLRDLKLRGVLSEAMLHAAAVELRRVHMLRDPLNGGRAWSHGDPHLGNFLYDEDTGQCHLIDFETTHLPNLGAQWRHSDDILTVCLALFGYRGGPDQLVYTFLKGYSVRSTLQELASRLYPPKGFQRILWSSRSDYLPFRQLCNRVSDLRNYIKDIQ